MAGTVILNRLNQHPATPDKKRHFHQLFGSSVVWFSSALLQPRLLCQLSLRVRARGIRSEFGPNQHSQRITREVTPSAQSTTPPSWRRDRLQPTRVHRKAGNIWSNSDLASLSKEWKLHLSWCDYFMRTS